MAIDTVKQVEVVQGKGSTCFYLDGPSRLLDKCCPTAQINGPAGLIGDPNFDHAVWPMLLVAKATGTYWGFDYEGYRQLLEYFTRPAQAEASGGCSSEIDHLTAARIRDLVRAERDLEPLVKQGWLRMESYQSPEGRIGVYFVSQRLAARAVAPRGAVTAPVVSRAMPGCQPPAAIPPPTQRSGRASHSLVSSPRNKPIF